mgnify:CR=1 FL=1
MIENTDQQVLSQLTRWIEARKKSWLATVIRTWGSSPGPVGSLMSCNEDGHISGSLSGGCIEEDLLEKMINSSPHKDHCHEVKKPGGRPPIGDVTELSFEKYTILVSNDGGSPNPQSLNSCKNT